MATSIGMMDPAYFVGRKEILDWLNGYLGISLSKVEETCTGAVACQLVDSLYPGKVPMSKVNWEAKSDPDYIANYKVLQAAFDRLNIDKHVDVQRLIRGKYMDNLEFMQWFKSYHDGTGAVEDYDPIGQRAKGKGGARYNQACGAKRPSASGSAARSGKSGGVAGATGTRGASASTSAGARGAGTSASRGVASGARPAGGGGVAAARKPSGAGAAASSSSSAAVNSARTAAVARAKISEVEADRKEAEWVAKTEALNQVVEDLRLTGDGLEKERDFYFGKLRDVELLLQNHEAEQGESELTASIFKVLYATNEDFERPEDEEAGEGREGDVAAGEEAEHVDPLTPTDETDVELVLDIPDPEEAA